jgi:DNA helicase IV
VRRQREDAGGAPSDAETTKVARSKPVREFVDAVWPALTAPALLARLYADREFLAACATDLLDEDEQMLLHWPAAPKSLKRAPWTPADAVLADELAGLLDGTPSYVHVVIDEAQDLSAMQCRAVARRCPLGSITVLGDLAQATTAWAPGSWDATLGHLGHPAATLRPLTAGYRVPGDVLELANHLLPHIAQGLAPATSVRTGSEPIQYLSRAELTRAIRTATATPGSVGVIVADADSDAVADELNAAGVPASLLGAEEDALVSVVPAGSSKGLEFDSVVLVEPAHIVAGESSRVTGLRRLYVTLTRAVSQLVIVHDEPLPAELTGVSR